MTKKIRQSDNLHAQAKEIRQDAQSSLQTEKSQTENLQTENSQSENSKRSPYRRLEDVVGCKWSAAVLAAIGRGVTRPGQIERFIPGISRKVLNERLKKLLDYRLITRTELPGAVPHTEYALTNTGSKLCSIIESIRDLDEEHDYVDD